MNYCLSSYLFTHTLILVILHRTTFIINFAAYLVILKQKKIFKYFVYILQLIQFHGSRENLEISRISSKKDKFMTYKLMLTIIITQYITYHYL